MIAAPTQEARIELGLAYGTWEAVLDEVKLATRQLEGLCVNLMRTEYVSSAGWEGGVIVGLLSVPGMAAFSRETALGLARRLLYPAGQQSASVVFPNETVLVMETDRWPS